MNKSQRGQGLVEYTLILVLVAVIVLVVITLVGQATTPARPAAFDGDTLTVVKSCAESNSRASTVMVGQVPITSKSVDADGLLRCLYAAGITLSRNGDPVKMNVGAS